MNLQEFINLRDTCPLCNSPLVSKFISNRKIKTKIDDDKFTVTYVMKGMRSCEPDYEVGFSFTLKDNTFCVEFYNEWNMYNHVTTYMIKIFKNFYENIRTNNSILFVRTCDMCFKYDISSKPINIDLKQGEYSSVEPYNETFIFTSVVDNEYKYILLGNFLDSVNPRSQLCWWKSPIDCKIERPIPSNSNMISELPLIPFVSKEETGNRLNNLITFA